MNQQEVLKILEEFGLRKSDIQVYFYLGKYGPQKGKQIAKALKISRQHIYISLKRLQMKGIINLTLEHPASFSALPFETVLDLYIKNRMQEIKRIEGEKPAILSDWQAIESLKIEGKSPKFSVLQGRDYIYSRLKQMIEETKEQFFFISTLPGLLQADKFGLLDAAFKHSSQKDTKFRFLTEVTKENLKTTKLLLARTLKTGANFEGRTPELGLKLTLRMLIRDDAEAAFFVSQEARKEASEIDDVCLWTNSASMVNSFKTVFEDFWRNSIDLEKKILEIETGKTASQTFVICNEDSARKEYIEKVLSAKKELLIMTSSQGVLDLETRILQLKELHQRNVTIRVVAPLTSENLKSAQQIFGYCNVRHAAINYLTTTIIDGEHLFQFKTPQNQGSQESSDQFDRTIYTNDSEYVEKTRFMFTEIWNNAQVPFLAQSEPQITKTESEMQCPPDTNRVKAYRSIDNYIEDPVFLGVDAQRDILKRILTAKRVKIKDSSKEPVIHYGSVAQAFVHPPENANLPNMLIQVFDSNAQSSFGEEKWLFVRVLRQTQEGSSYVPTVYVGTNPKSVAFWKNNNPGYWTERNCLLFKRDQLEVRVQGNSLFAGWTKPISLSPFQLTLPPACMFFEGYGGLRTSISKTTVPQGLLLVHEINAFEAFATFYNPSWKYSAPGTEGLFMRDSIFTLNPRSKN